MRVLLLNTSFRSEGPNNTFREIAERAAALGLEVWAGALSGRGTIEGVYRKLGIPCVYFGRPGIGGFGIVDRVARFLRDRKIDIVNCQLLRGEVVGALAAARAPGTVFVCTVQNEDPYRRLAVNPPKALLSRWALGRATAVITVSESLGEFVRTYQGVESGKIHVIPNSVSPARFPTRGTHQPPPDFPDSTKIIGSVGRLSRQKGYTYLIDAFHRVAKMLPDTELMLIGSGPDESRLRKKRQSGPASGRIRFVGHRETVERYLPFFELYVQPSLWEGMPFATLEAMASGIPVIASAVGGLRDLIEHGTHGILTPPGDSRALAEEIVRLMRDDDLRSSIAREGRRRVHTHFGADAMATAYAHLYHRLNGVDDRHRQHPPDES